MNQKEVIKNKFRDCIETHPCECYSFVNDELETYDDIIEIICKLPNIIKAHINDLLKDEHIFGNFKSLYKLIREDYTYTIKRVTHDETTIEEFYTLDIPEKLRLVEFLNNENTLNKIETGISYYNDIIINKKN